jgi:O-Antigen ligase
MTALLLIIMVLLFGAAFAWFVYLERTGRPLTVLLALVGLLLVESALYASPFEIPVGLLHPEFWGLSFRVFDVLIPAAVVARLMSGREARLEPALLWWGPFAAWMVAAGLLGLVRGNNLAYLTFEGKLLIYLALVPLAAGIPARTYLTSRGVHRLVMTAAALAALLTVTQLLRIAIAIPLPLLEIETLGELGADLASLFVALGILVLAVSLCMEGGRTGWALLAVPLLVCPLAVGQRAALLGLTVSLIAVALLAPLARRHLRTTPTEVAVFLAAGLALATLPAAAPAVSEARPGSLPFSGVVTGAFTSRAKQLSQEDRVNQWKKARTLLAERPVFGWGLGTAYTYWDPGYFRFKETNLTHNIAGDLLLRTGAVGLLLFLVPVGLTLAAGLRGLLTAQHRGTAALAIGAIAAAAGMLARGGVESIFEKFRLAMFLAVLLGIALAAARDAERPAAPGGWVAR